MNIIGIDLGTTFCAVAKINDLGNPEIVPFGFGGRLLPSCVYIEGDKVIVGKEAQTYGEGNPSNYFEMIKRYMDREFYPELDENKRPIEGSARKVDGKPVSTVYLQSLILKYIKDDFEPRYGKIDKVIVTVPAYFDETRRNATVESAKLAGLPIIASVNALKAASLFYSVANKIRGKNIVFQMTRETVSIGFIDIIRQEKNIYINTKATVSDLHLGGKYFDLCILEEQEAVYQTEKDDLLYEDESTRMQLLARAEEIKKHLSTSEAYKGRLQGNAGNIVFDLTRKRFEVLISGYAQRVKILFKSLVDSANVKQNDINHVFLVGHSLRIPLFKKIAENIFPKKSLEVVNTEESVVLGAALECLRRYTNYMS